METSILITAILICAGSSIPALISSIKRFVCEEDCLSGFLVLMSGLITTTFCSALFHTVYIPPMEQWMIIGLTSIIICTNTLLWMFVKNVRKKTLWRWIIVSLLVSVLLIFAFSIYLSILTSRPLESSFFLSCCCFLELSGAAWGLEYKEISVIINIYMQAALCLFSALWVTWESVKRFSQHKTVRNGMLMSAGIAYGLAFLTLFIIICIHYAMPLNEAFDICYHELIKLSASWNVSYIMVNFIIFIFLFLILTIGNVFFAKIIKQTSSST